MFVPSEAVYAELHETFPDIVQRAHRTRVVIVSPNMLMLAIQTMQAILKDVQMREAAGRIQQRGRRDGGRSQPPRSAHHRPGAPFHARRARTREARHIDDKSHQTRSADRGRSTSMTRTSPRDARNHVQLRRPSG